MANVDYDQFAGLARLADAAAMVDQRAAVILTYHAAIEREIDIVLARLLPRADRLGGFHFSNKIHVLAAAWRGNHEAGEKLFETLLRFNRLRNAVAHAHPAGTIDGRLQHLLEAYHAMVPEGGGGGGGEIKIGELAAGICGFMADGPSPLEVRATFEALDQLVNVRMPAALGVGRADRSGAGHDVLRHDGEPKPDATVSTG